jgi:hypothetical protein
MKVRYQRQPELIRIGAPPAAHLPCIACDYEAIPRHVERIEVGPECFALRTIKLCVDQAQRDSVTFQY